MKKLSLSLLLLSIAVAIFAQVPEAIKYQAVYRDASGQVKANHSANVVFIVHSSSPTGNVVFEEEHTVETNAYGLFSINLGEGSGSNTLGDVNWGADDYFLEVKIDGTSMGTSQMLSVPYALYAGDAAKLGGASAREWDEAIMYLQNELAALKTKINSVNDSVVLRSPDGTIWNVWIDDEGNLQTKNGDFVITYTTYSSYPGMPISSIDASESDSVDLPCSDENYETFATAEGKYTDFSRGNCTYKANLTDVEEGLFCGVAFTHSRLYSDNTNIVASQTISVYSLDNEFITSFQTDENGRFAIDLQPGSYYFNIGLTTDPIFDPELILISNTSSIFNINKYTDLHFILSELMVLKPNIYIYPEQEQATSVTLEFPQGGEVVVSDPEYGNGWNVNITPDGIIDGEYTFLFYESSQPDKWQYTSGWIIAREDLTDFFISNMTALNFNEQEINDFIEYWIPLLTDKPYYGITPQFNNEVDPLIDLKISPQPQNINRLFYCIQGMDNNNYTGFEEPELPNFQRTGYTVMEWGVIIK